MYMEANALMILCTLLIWYLWIRLSRFRFLCKCPLVTYLLHLYSSSGISYSLHVSFFQSFYQIYNLIDKRHGSQILEQTIWP